MLFTIVPLPILTVVGVQGRLVAGNQSLLQTIPVGRQRNHRSMDVGGPQSHRLCPAFMVRNTVCK